jgi:hypothetical protein
MLNKKTIGTTPFTLEHPPVRVLEMHISWFVDSTIYSPHKNGDSHPSQDVSFNKHILMCWVSSPPKHQSNVSLMLLPKKITYSKWRGKVKVLVYSQYVF